MSKITYRIIDIGKVKRIIVYNPGQYWTIERTIDAKDFPTVESALAWVSSSYPNIEEDDDK